MGTFALMGATLSRCTSAVLVGGRYVTTYGITKRTRIRGVLSTHKNLQLLCAANLGKRRSVAYPSNFPTSESIIDVSVHRLCLTFDVRKPV
jgi:hypothetical protein